MRSAEKNFSYKTGGGQYNPPKFQDREFLEEVLSLVTLAAEGLESQFDDDHIPLAEGRSSL